MSLRIHQIKSNSKTFLSLEGTILVINERKRYVKSEIQIPVELITIYENKMFRAKCLFISFLSLPLLAFSGSMLYASFFMIQNIDKIKSKDYIIMSGFLVLFIGGIIFFLIFLIKFLFRKKSVSLVITPNNSVIEFWKERKNSREIDELLDQIEYRKTIVEESLLQPSQQKIVGFIDKKPMIPILVGSLIIFSMLALMTRNIHLMYLALIPPAWFLYNKILAIRRVPKLFRQASKHYFKEEWDKAVILLKTQQEQFPEYLPVYTLLISIYTRTNRYDEAMEIASQLPAQYIDIANKIQTDVWRYKRINQRRKENIHENNNGQ